MHTLKPNCIENDVLFFSNHIPRTIDSHNNQRTRPHVSQTPTTSITSTQATSTISENGKGLMQRKARCAAYIQGIKQASKLCISTIMK